MTQKTLEELEDEEEQMKLLHILSMPEKSKNDICIRKCPDKLCNAGCLQQKAKQFRPQIMRGVKRHRELHLDSDKYPLYAGAAFESHRPCQGGNLGVIGSHDKICSDPVCGVTGCLDAAAWQFRYLIELGGSYKE